MVGGPFICHFVLRKRRNEVSSDIICVQIMCHCRPIGQSRLRVKYLCDDRLIFQQSQIDMGLCDRRRSKRANNLDCRCTSPQPKAFHRRACRRNANCACGVGIGDSCEQNILHFHQSLLESSDQIRRKHHPLDPELFQVRLSGIATTGCFDADAYFSNWNSVILRDIGFSPICKSATGLIVPFFTVDVSSRVLLFF